MTELPSTSNATTPDVAAASVFPASAATLSRRKLRHFKDKLAAVSIAVGGLGVIAAVLLIFLYLVYEVMPLFRGAVIQEVSEFRLQEQDNSRVLHLALEERLAVAMRLGEDGQAVYFNTADGAVVSRIPLQIPVGQTISSFALDTDVSGIVALGLSGGDVLIAQYAYDVTFGVNNARIVTPVIRYPFGSEPYDMFNDEPVSRLSVRSGTGELMLAGTSSSGVVTLLRARRETNLFSAFNAPSDSDWEVETATLNGVIPSVDQLYLDVDRRWLFALGATGRLSMVDVRPAFTGGTSVIEEEVLLVESPLQLTEVSFLLGGISLLVGDSSGNVSQWFLVRRDGNFAIEKVRDFDAGGRVVALSPEQRRKNFVTANEQGYIGIYNSTAHRQVAYEQLVTGVPETIAVSARGDGILIETTTGNFSFWSIENRHPEVSWEALWQEVWYENYQEPEYIWQSSAANNDFEPKYSLAPLSFGTLKAAFYAMLLAAPLAVCGAIFTGYFMAPAMRQNVKPLIELMEALPTVVLGFLAGLWLAPFLENNLLGVFSLLILTPIGILLAAFAWSRLPDSIRYRVPAGWEAGLLIPVILLVGMLSFAMSGPIELAFFGGDMRSWITNDLGIAYDQRNAMVVGFAMGFAVIPTIFSIAEDAVFTVPRQLTYGSLALGATPWQTLSRVVLPTASPGIFSALMIGMGRAVGETMIVLMATGNTPIMDINIFEGMRTLAANIAVEVPESEVDSTHYRILFLAALVLFMFTFVVNTLAEIIRQRLRRKYSTI
ncbi:MAG: ABC transporter permease subunit [Gammaproteobacteria bacterium]|nr:ABC transporter permease subunit [Gammaproteobacteria bacterium]MDP2139458.1 ABC transporter permease subunit [Gammaproteobacteria bacterium]MDP2346294.1 ABC transporter permease subunit [Gammaproteobacteria bacterium]